MGEHIFDHFEKEPFAECSCEIQADAFSQATGNAYFYNQADQRGGRTLEREPTWEPAIDAGEPTIGINAWVAARAEAHIVPG